MKPSFVLLLAACVMPMAFASGSSPNTLSDAEKADAWVLLFDGENASEHFRGYGKDGFPEGWVAERGALVGKGGGDIITKDQYGSFELHIDWMISEGGNSGIMFKVQETDAPSYMTGPEAQILDNVKGTHPQKAGWLFHLYPADKDTTNPAGQWNHFVLICQKTAKGTYKCEHWMNGEKYVEYEIGSDDWNEKVAKSRFKNRKDFAKDEGHICLQYHGDRVWFRNIKIRELAAIK